MNLPKKKYSYGLVGDKPSSGYSTTVVLDSEGMKQLADYINRMCLISFEDGTKTQVHNGNMNKVIKFLRGE